MDHFAGDRAPEQALVRIGPTGVVRTPVWRSDVSGWPLPIVAEPGPLYAAQRLRIYVDTSVFGGGDDRGRRESSHRLFGWFREGIATMLLSDLTVRKLEDAPKEVRARLSGIPEAHIERIPESEAATQLAASYVIGGAIPQSSGPDAVHIALATLVRADYLVSWNVRHMVNPRRIRAYNAINRRSGHQEVDIRTPKAVHLDDL